MSKGRRRKPRTREGRKRAAELGRIIASPRSPKAEREAALRELDTLAPLEGSTSSESILSELPPAKPTNADLLALADRVEAKRESGSSFSDGSPAGEGIPEYWLGIVDKIEGERREFPARYESASPAERTRLFAERYPLTPPTKFPELAQRFRLPECDVKPKVTPPPASKIPEPVKPNAKPPAPTLTPSEQLEADLSRTVNLVLQVIDAQYLGRLANHSPEYDSAIRAALTNRLASGAAADAVWLANTYNAMRPKNLSAFPPRTF
jgi:hypothetical protein